ncbi:MAG: hypothetical protein ACF8SC_00500 [Phycisphaerales bacterium JB037]
MILYLASDLLWATRIKEAAKDLGLNARPVRNVGMLEDRLNESRQPDAEPVAALILDLEAPEPARELLGRLRGPGATDPDRRVRILAFSPHVHRDLMQSFRDDGADEVLTRGAFDHNLADILLALEARAS